MIYKLAVTVAGCGQRLPSEIHYLTIMSVEKKKPQIHRPDFAVFYIVNCVEISKALAHFLPVHQQKIIMKPVTNEWLAGRRFRLGDFVFVVNGNKGYGAGVNVHSSSKIFHTHRRTFYVPAGKAFTPSGRPAHNVIFEPACRFKPQD